MAAQSTVKIGQLLDEHFVAAPGTGIWRDYLLAVDYRPGKPPLAAYEAATVDAEFQAAATAKGISITAESTENSYGRPDVVCRTVKDKAECVIAIGDRDTSLLAKEMLDVAKDVAEIV